VYKSGADLALLALFAFFLLNRKKFGISCVVSTYMREKVYIFEHARIYF
jgi:hypothetical protein